ncbi:mRNA-decapping enzyme-like protein [Arachis hypogaea]|nr:mRNA-decapping enzyme-like protein [Arachis hypogaea]
MLCELLTLARLLQFKNDIAAALRASPPSMILPLHRCHVHQCFSSDDRILKQKDKLKKHSAPGDSRKEAQAALLILLQSFSTLSSVEVAKQELLEIQEGKSNLKAKEPLLQCIHAYREFMSCREQDDYEVVRKVGRGKYNEVFDLRAFTPPIMKNASSRSSNPSRRKSNAAVFSFSILFHFILSSYGNECCAGASMANFGPMSQSQSKKLMPNLDRQSTKVLNLTVLQRFNPFIAEILFTAAHVSFYEFNIETNQWTRKDVEGSLFVVKRNV